MLKDCVVTGKNFCFCGRMSNFP